MFALSSIDRVEAGNIIFDGSDLSAIGQSEYDLSELKRTFISSRTDESPSHIYGGHPTHISSHSKIKPISGVAGIVLFMQVFPESD